MMTEPQVPFYYYVSDIMFLLVLFILFRTLKIADKIGSKIGRFDLLNFYRKGKERTKENGRK